MKRNFKPLAKKNYIFGIIAGIIIFTGIIYYAKGCAEVVYEEYSETNNRIIEYGLDVTDLESEDASIKTGEVLSSILGRYGVSASRVEALKNSAKDIFNLRSIRVGHNYRAYYQTDSLERKNLQYFVYEKNKVDYVVFTFKDTIAVHLDQKEVKRTLKKVSVEIQSSLYTALVNEGSSPALAVELSEIYAWTVDFFGLQKGDRFSVLYEELSIDTISIGTGAIHGALFENSGKKFYAIPFEQNGKVSFWDENGNSLRKNFLKAPLKYSRISSKFSNSRMHPVLKIRRPHHAVDYAAPAGTPVFAIGAGTITKKGYHGGGGNTVKIKHNRGLESAYLHLKGFAKGLKIGQKVAQGDLIGYVGSTGISSGAHLDFRIWRDGKPIDPLTLPSEPAEPIKTENKTEFDKRKANVISIISGDLDIEKIFVNEDLTTE